MLSQLDSRCNSVEEYNSVKQNVIKQFAINAVDTGSANVQIALLTQRILYLTEHTKNNHNDKAARYALLLLVAKRNKYMKYLKRTDAEEYEKVVEKLGIRKK